MCRWGSLCCPCHCTVAPRPLAPQLLKQKGIPATEESLFKAAKDKDGLDVVAALAATGVSINARVSAFVQG